MYTRTKETIWFKKEVGEYNEEKRHLICFLHFHGLQGNLSIVLCIFKLCVFVVKGRLGGVVVKLVYFRTLKSKNYKAGNIICRRIPPISFFNNIFCYPNRSRID